MAIHKSALKRSRQTIKITERNRSLRSRMRNFITDFRKKVKEGTEGNHETFKNVASMISKVATKGVIHKKTASRKISRLAKALNKSK